MAEQLAAKSADIIQKLATGLPVTLGGQPVSNFTEPERRLLGVIASDLAGVEGLKSSELVETVARRFAANTDTASGAAVPPATIRPRAGLRLWGVRAQAFRGLAP